MTDFVERLMKHASNGEVLLFKQPLDKRLHQLLSYTPELNLASLTELEFISNFQAIQVRTEKSCFLSWGLNILHFIPPPPKKKHFTVWRFYS